MNFLGAFGTLVENTGLRNILKVVYEDHTVPHMMTVKAISRGLRGHVIVDQCLSTLLANIFMEETENTMKEQLSIFLFSLKSGEVEIDNVIRTDVLCEISNKFETEKNNLKKASKTAMMWLGYQEMITILRELLRAERLGIWDIHLNMIRNILPIFAAAGHDKYAMSAYLYLQ